MKRIAMACSIIMLLFTYSCDQQEGTILLDSDQKNPNINLKSHAHQGECDATTVTLTAGQHIDAGTVTVSNDDTTLYVTYATSGDWVLEETHLYVGDEDDIPLNGGGNPRIGHFTYQETHDGIQSYTYEVALADLSDCFAVITHAVVNKVVNGEVVQSETAFGCGDKTFPGKRWGCYFEYCKQDCQDECELAYAFHDGCGFCSVDDGFYNEFAYGSFILWNFAVVDLYLNPDGCDVSNAEKIGYFKLSPTVPGEFTVETVLFDEYKACQVSITAGNNVDPSLNTAYEYEYDPASSTPFSFSVTWPDTTKSLFFAGGVRVTK